MTLDFSLVPHETHFVTTEEKKLPADVNYRVSILSFKINAKNMI